MVPFVAWVNLLSQDDMNTAYTFRLFELGYSTEITP